MAVCDYNEIVRGLRLTMPEPNSIFEVRTIQAYNGFINTGYFDSATEAANAVCGIDGDNIGGIYVTLNPVHPDAFARCSNRFISARAGQCTTDKEILYRNSLFLDFDPKRDSGVTGISSTDEEHEAVLEYAWRQASFLTALYGFPAPMLIDSGNGAHCRYRTELMPNCPETDKLFKDFTACAHGLFTTPMVDLDRSVFNASRIVRMAGSWARKGEDTPRRPWRMARVMREHGPGLVTADQMKLFINTNSRHITGPAKPQANGTQPLHLNGYDRARAEYPDDEKLNKNLNALAKKRCNDWIPHIFAGLVRPSGEKWRLSNKNLPTGYTEDFLLDEKAFKDFGSHDMGDATEGRRTAITMVADLVYDGDKNLARQALAARLDTSITDFGHNLILDRASIPEMPKSLMGLSEIEYKPPKNAYDSTMLGHAEGLSWLIDGYVIADAYNIFGAPPKIGKSTFLRQIVASCLLGSTFLDVICPKIQVLYIAYEDLEGNLTRNVEHHMRKALFYLPKPQADKVIAEALKGCLFYAPDRENASNGVPGGLDGQEFIARAVRENPGIKLVVLDPSWPLVDRTARSMDITVQQYEQHMDFVRLALKLKVALIGVAHNNKNSGRASSVNDDSLISIGGTNSVTASAQNIIQFTGDRPPEDCEGDYGIGLNVVGRISGHKQRVLQFIDGSFSLAPAGVPFYTKDVKRDNKLKGLPEKILAFATSIPKTIPELQQAITDYSDNAIRTTTKKLVQEGKLMEISNPTGAGIGNRAGPRPNTYLAIHEPARMP